MDAALVYATDARARSGALRVVAQAPAGSHPPIVYPIAPLRQARHPALARQFIAFLLSPEGQAILARYGFLSTAARRVAAP